MAKKKTKKTAKKAKPARKTVKKAAVKKTKKPKTVGRVTHYFGKIKVAIVKCLDSIRLGEAVAFRGATTDFEIKVASMQFDHEPIVRSKKRQEVGIKVPKRVREGDTVYKQKE